MIKDLCEEMSDVFNTLEKEAFIPNQALSQPAAPDPAASGAPPGMPPGIMPPGMPPKPPEGGALPGMPGADQNPIAAMLSQLTGGAAQGNNKKIEMTLDELIHLIKEVTGKGAKTDKGTDQRLAQLENIMGIPSNDPNQNPMAAQPQPAQGDPTKQATVYGKPEKDSKTKKIATRRPSKVERLVFSLLSRTKYDGMKPRTDK